MKLTIKPKAEIKAKDNITSPDGTHASAVTVPTPTPAPAPAPATSVIKIAKKAEISIMGGKAIEETYQDKELRQHIYDSPDTYAGSIDPNKETMWVFDKLTGKMVKKQITFIEAFFKCFDEILVNAIDQHQRINEKLAADPSCSLKPVRAIKVHLDKETGWITVENDGEGIEIVKHAKNDKYIPQMLFGQLLTSINYDKSEKRTVGGKNGYGGKITNIFSKEFVVETVDSHRKLRFKQTYRNNMTVEEPPIIESYSKVPYTKIMYLPDYERFGIKDFKTIDDWELLARRVYDASACTDKACTTYLNGEKINVKTFEEYVNLYIGNKRETKRVYYQPNPRWEVVLCLSSGDFEQVSFVNGIFTDRGGKHVSHVADNLTKKLAETLNEKNKKKGLDVKPSTVKRYLWLFVKSIIENPSFDTQTKRNLTTLVPNFGSKCELTDDFITQASKLGILEKTLALAEFKAKEQLGKKTDGAKSRRVYHEKLQDATAAGSSESLRAILVLTEGDSAKTFFSAGIKGLSNEERRYWGCFPLKGKLLNVRTATLKQLENNDEIANIKKIVGLKEGVDYSGKNINQLRYGRIMILSDADRDGDHIKGLVINFIQTYWPALVQRGDFVCSFATPIVKTWPEKYGEDPKPEQTLKFYSDKAYREWYKTKHGAWSHKYYKGLGTHTPPEATDCFKHMSITTYTWGNDMVDFNNSSVSSSGFAIELAFSKKFEDNRKEWLLNYDANPTEEPAYDVKEETIADFINKRMILFSKADNIRSIPSLFDGLKPSQRKAIYTYMAGNYKKQIKVAQLTGSMLEKAAYHHGEASAYETIIGLAQDYVGSGNMNLFHPAGQFGSRVLKGKDHASARYIFIGSTPYLSTVFNEHDNPLLDYLEDDGSTVEPKWYLPIIPLVLVNGGEGIGTGWSSTIPCYNPLEIVDNLKRKMLGDAMLEMTPWYRGFNGKVVKTGEGKYVVVGDWHRTGKNTIRINELPVGAKNCKSFTAYKAYIFALVDDECAKRKKKDDDDDEKSVRSGFGDERVVEDVEIFEETDTKLGVDITFKDGILDRELADNTGFKFEKKLKIAVAFSTTNMHLYTDGKIKKYSSPLEIIEDYFPIRLEYYDKRKKHMIAELEHKLALNNAKYRFVSEIMDGVITIYKKNKAQIIAILDGTAAEGAASPAYPLHTNKVDGDEDKASYEYLLSMRIDSFSQEKLRKLRDEIENIENAIAQLTAKTIQQLWIDDLDEFAKVYTKGLKEWAERNKIEVLPPRKAVSIVKNKKPVAIALKTPSEGSGETHSPHSEEVAVFADAPKDVTIVELKKKLAPESTSTVVPASVPAPAPDKPKIKVSFAITKK